MNVNKYAMISAIVAVSVLTTGCASFYGVVDPSSMKVQTNMNWTSDLPDLEPIDSSRRIVYLSYKDASGGDLPNLRDDIEHSLSECGYMVTKNVSESWFSFEVRVLEFGKTEDGSAMATIVGAAAGGVTGAAAGGAIAGKDGAIVGGVGGGGVAAIAARIIDKHHPIQIYSFKIEVNVRERIPEGFSENLMQSITSRTVYKPNEEVTTTSNISSDLVKQHSFVNHKNTLVITTRKRDMTENEAYEAVISRLTKAFGGLLPDVDSEIDPITPAEYLENLKNQSSENDEK